MQLDIPNGKIIDTPGPLDLFSDAAQVYAGLCQVDAYRFIVDPEGEVEQPGMQVRVGDKVHEGSLCLVNAVGKALLVTFPCLHGEEVVTATIYVREGVSAEESWRISTKALLLPADSPSEWGSDEDVFDQRAARHMLFVALVLANGWSGGR